MTLLELIEAAARQLDAAGVAFGHGTLNAFDEAAWLVMWRLKLPLHDLDSVTNRPVAPAEHASVAILLEARITSRKPAAYLTREAWLQGVPFYIDERAIVPRSFIAEAIADGALDAWLDGDDAAPPRRVLDLCTGNGSLAVLAALAWPEARIDAADISRDALAVARINVEKHGLASRVRLIESDGLERCRGPYDLILCNPPYVNEESMARLPPEFAAEPRIALAGGADGMDFIRPLLAAAPRHLTRQAALALEVGHERANFEAAFPALEAIWLETSAGWNQVALLTREALSRLRQ